MCLYVTHVPTNHKKSLVMPVWKKMTKDDNGYRTPFQDVRADQNGCLFNSNPIYYERNNYGNLAYGVRINDNGYYYHDSLSSQIVHSYYDEPKERSLKAYAIGVVAYGYSNIAHTGLVNVGSIALYIPFLDKSNLKRKRINYLKQEKHDFSSLIQLFPKLKQKREDFHNLGFYTTCAF